MPKYVIGKSDRPESPVELWLEIYGETVILMGQIRGTTDEVCIVRLERDGKLYRYRNANGIGLDLDGRDRINLVD